MMSNGLCIVIVLLGIIGSMFSVSYYVEAQTIPIPEFQPKAPEAQDDGSNQIEPEAEPEPPRPTDFAMKVQLEPHEDDVLRELGHYQVSDFAFATSNSSALCPTGNCEIELDNGDMLEFIPGEKQLTGDLRVNTGVSTKIMDLYASWQTIEESQQDGEPVQVIEGTFDAGNDPMNPEYQSQINGTLVPDGDDLILEAHGITGSPYE